MMEGMKKESDLKKKKAVLTVFLLSTTNFMYTNFIFIDECLSLLQSRLLHNRFITIL